jgi:hypothetical protein
MALGDHAPELTPAIPVPDGDGVPPSVSADAPSSPVELAVTYRVPLPARLDSVNGSRRVVDVCVNVATKLDSPNEYSPNVPEDGKDIVVDVAPSDSSVRSVPEPR